MRIVKEADERRNEILDKAEELFMLNGYEKTSVQGIIDRVGIAKGTFYYYFRSKEEVLDGIVERYNRGMIKRIKDIAEQPDLSCEERFLRTIQAMQVSEEISPVVMEQIHAPQNILLHQKMIAGILKNLVPVISEVVKEGVEEGVFSTDYPTESVEMLLAYGMTVIDGECMELTEAEKQQRTIALIGMGERLLGMKVGRFMDIMKDSEGE